MKQNKPKPTPGPWRIGDNGATVFGPKTDAPSPRTIATLTKVPMVLNETKANAALIAAAPEMLEALEALHDKNYENLKPNERAQIIVNAGKAIAKAKGENQ